MDDVTDDVIIARRFETDHRIFRVWHMYFGATFFVVALTPYCTDFVVIATIFSVVMVLFSCSVRCINHVEYRHVNS